MLTRLLSSLALLGLITTTFNAGAQQQTNVIRTSLDAFEAQTGTVIFRNSGQIGAISANEGTITITARQSIDLGSNRKAYGVAITVRYRNDPDTSIIDYDELNSLLAALDFLAGANWSAASMDGFDTFYNSRDGLRISVHSSNKHSGVIDLIVLSNHTHPIKLSLNAQQFSQLKPLIQQAKNKLDSLGASR